MPEPGTLWCPANGRERGVFQREYCVRCEVDIDYKCDVLRRAYVGEPTLEWIIDWDGFRTCRAFKEVT